MCSFISDVKFAFMNVHLESTKVMFNLYLLIIYNLSYTYQFEYKQDFGKERTEQLGKCFDEIKKIGDQYTVILAGDMNIRDSEIEKLNGLPLGIYDMWIKTGRRKEVQYTWDCLRNTNTEIPGR